MDCINIRTRTLPPHHLPAPCLAPTTSWLHTGECPGQPATQALIQLCDRLDIGTLSPRNTLLVLGLPFAASSFVSHGQLMIQGLG